VSNRRGIPGAAERSMLAAGLAVSAILALGAPARATDAITFISQSDYPPMEFFSADGRMEGLSIDLARWVARDLGREAVFTHAPFSEAQARIQHGRADLLTSLFRTPRRESLFRFSRPYLRVQTCLYVRTDSSAPKHRADLAGARVATQRGDAAAFWLADHMGDAALVLYSDFPTALQALLDGSVAALAADAPVFHSLLRRWGIEKQVRPLGAPLYVSELCMAARRDRLDLIRDLNASLERARDSGLMAELSMKWLGVATDEPSWIALHRDELLVALGALLLAALAAVAWNIALRRELRRKLALLMKTDSEYRKISELLQDVICRRSFESDRYEYVSDGVETLTGYAPGEFYRDARLMERLIHPDWRSAYRRVERRLRRGLVRSHFEYPIVTRGGETRWLRQRIGLLRDGQGNVTGYEGVVTDVTRRRRAEIETRETLQKYRTVFEQSGDSLVLIDPEEETFLEFNSPACRRLEYEPEEFSRLAVSRVEPSLTRQRLRAIVEELKETPILMSQTQLLSKTGKRFDVRLRISALHLGGRTRLLAAWHDIAEQIEALREVERSREEWERTFDSTPDLISIMDTEYRVRQVNRAMADAVGRAKADCVGMTCYELVHDLYEAPAFCPHTLMMSDGKTHTVEIFEKKLNGYYAVTVSPLWDRHGRLQGCVHVARDITERRRQDLALKRHDAILEAVSFAADRFLREGEWTSQIPDVLSRLGSAAKTGRVKLFDFAEGESGRTLGSLRFEWVSSPWTTAIQDNDTQDIDFDQCGLMENVQVLAGGRALQGHVAGLEGGGVAELYASQGVQSFLILPVFVQGRLWGALEVDQCDRERTWSESELDAVRAAAGIIGAAITREAIQEERRRLEEGMRASQKLESLGVLAGGIAHDFNNLLMAMLGNAEMADEELPGDHPLRHRLEAIRESGRRASGLCRQMMAYAGRTETSPHPTDLNELIEGMAELIAASVSKKHAVARSLEPDLPRIQADPGQMRQILMALVSNASEAMGEAAGTIRISTARRDRGLPDGAAVILPPANEGLSVALCVADDGPGLDERHLHRIFEPFFTTRFPGRGMGLAALHGIVRSHEGGIFVENRPGRGASFHILLPAAPGEAAPVEDAAPSGEWRPSGTVLVVDDEQPIRTLARQMLLRMGLDVLEAASGREAVRLYRKGSGEIIGVLLDMAMPEMNGAEVYRELLAIREDARVIVTTGYDETDVLRHFAEIPPDAILQKPYEARRLSDLIQTVFCPKKDE
jgi:PAS domain S-box-containing protein